MNYKYATENQSYEDYASGRVLYNQQGATSFPVRLASELFQYCAEILGEEDREKPYTIYDPCCGGAYLLTVLGFLHGGSISKIFASDIDNDILPLAEKNLSLLTAEGLDRRIEQLDRLLDEYGKESHTEALQSADRLKKILESRVTAIPTQCFQADITSDEIYEKMGRVDMVITDLPYGNLVHWDSSKDEEQAITALLENLLSVLEEQSVVVIISMKKTPVKHARYKKLKQLNTGKRQVVILKPYFF